MNDTSQYIETLQKRLVQKDQALVRSAETIRVLMDDVALALRALEAGPYGDTKLLERLRERLVEMRRYTRTTVERRR